MDIGEQGILLTNVQSAHESCGASCQSRTGDLLITRKNDSPYEYREAGGTGDGKVTTLFEAVLDQGGAEAVRTVVQVIVKQSRIGV